MNRVALSLFAVLLCACAQHPGATVFANQAEDSAADILMHLETARSLHAEGQRYAARDAWENAKTAYNAHLQDGVAFHSSDAQSLKLSYLLGQVAREFESKKADASPSYQALRTELNAAVMQIPRPPVVDEMTPSHSVASLAQ